MFCEQTQGRRFLFEQTGRRNTPEWQSGVDGVILFLFHKHPFSGGPANKSPPLFSPSFFGRFEERTRRDGRTRANSALAR